MQDKKISRQTFIKGIAAGAVSLSAFGALSLVESGTSDSDTGSDTTVSDYIASAAEGLTFTPGTYTASAQGISSEVTVTMTFDETSITDCQIDVSGETATIGALIGDEMASAILTAQSADVDSVSGATITSTAVKTAAADCIAQASGTTVESEDSSDSTANTDPYYDCRTMDWLGDAPEIDSSEIIEEKNYDIVVVGGGHAGILAALAACDDGASVGVIENLSEDAWTVNGEDIGQWNSKWAIDKGFGPYNVGEVVNEFVKRSCGRANPMLIKSYIENSGPSFDRLIEITEATGDPDGILSYGSGEDDQLIVQVQKGVDNYPMEVCGYKTWATAAQFMGPISHETVEGTASFSTLPTLMGNAVAETKAEGAEWTYDAHAEKLVQDDEGNVTGVIASTDDGYVQFNASKGVIVCTGDFSGNAAMNWNLIGEAGEWLGRSGEDGDSWTFGSFRDGSGHKMCCWAGGAIEPAPRGMMMAAVGPKGPWGQAPFLWLNKNGDRFTNEGACCCNVGTVFRQPLGLMTLVTDSKWYQNVCAAGLEHGGPNYGRPVYYDEMEEDMAKVVAAGAEGYSVRGCTVAEREAATVYGAEDLDTLLGYLGYEGDAKEEALASIERYNELCENGLDEDYGRDTALYPVNEGPFYGCIYDNSTAKAGLVTLAGLVTDEHQNVMKGNLSAPIKGLYVAGNCLGGRYGMGYTTPCAGNSIGWAQASGWAAGHHVASL